MATAASRASSSSREDVSRVEDFLQSLARAVRQFHTYPTTSPRCLDAVEECRRTLSRIEVDAIACVVSPHALLVEGTAIGRDTLVEHELARRLYESRCRAIDIDRTATGRDIARLCTELAGGDGQNSLSLADRLWNHGVERIHVGAEHHPEVVEIQMTAAARASVEHDQRWRDAVPSTGRVAHLYPADKGWIRIDPGQSLNQITLTGLALLVEDPAALAHTLSRLAGDGDEAQGSPGDALEARCGDVARLYSSLEPATARSRFARLATAVLALEPPQRRRLLSSTVLPALVDGRPEGDILRDFPDVDLADSLSLLLDVETAAPELLASALDRLHLSPDRRNAIAPLMEERIRARQATTDPAHRRNDAALRERTQQLIRSVNGDAAFDGFAAFDLHIDAATEETIAQTGAAIVATNLADAELACLSQLIALNPNPEVAERLLGHAPRLLSELERTKSWVELGARLAALQATATALHASRPDVATAITTAVETFYTPARTGRLTELYNSGDEQRAIACLLITAAGKSLIPAVLRDLQDGADATRLLHLVRDHASIFAPELAATIDALPVSLRVGALRALAAAGHGFERPIARQLDHQNESVVREALRALARVGSNEAAELVTRYLLHAGNTAALAAEEALWCFSPAATRHSLRTLLRQRQFVVANPELVSRLLERTDRFEPKSLSDVITPLTSLRFWFWNRRLKRIGRRATVLLRS